MTITVGGGQPPYTLSITPAPAVPYNTSIPSAGSIVISNVTSTTYDVRVTDARNCQVHYPAFAPDTPGYVNVLRPTTGAIVYMYRPFAIQYQYLGGTLDRTVSIELHHQTRGLVYTIESSQSGIAQNGLVQTKFPHRLIPGKYRMRVWTNCGDSWTGVFDIRASQTNM
jgi:hypothetical protein